MTTARSAAGAAPDGHHGEGYTGPATLLIDGAELAVEVDLRGHFEPIDGYFHWYGRVASADGVTAAVTGNRARVVLRTPAGERPAELSDPDLWGRFRITGTSTPPFDTGAGQPPSGRG